MQDYAIADQAQRIIAQNTGGNEVQYGFLAGNDQRMSGVVTALETHHGANLLGEQVDNFAFALIAPLCSQYDDRLTHDTHSRMIVTDAEKAEQMSALTYYTRFGFGAER
jgi:hypothetical protein